MADIELRNRAQLVCDPDVQKSLSHAEALVLKATAEKTIEEYDDGAEFLGRINNAFAFIAGDIGYSISDRDAWGKLMVRFATLLKRYYSHMTIDDVRMAFEMLCIGALDPFLPRDSQGNPDRKHYGQFNADYLCRILNAYRRERGRVVQKAQNARPKPRQEMSDRDKARYNAEIANDIINAYTMYQSEGRLPAMTYITEMLIHNKLVELGFAERVDVDNSEMTFKDMLAEQTETSTRYNAIINALDRMIMNGMDVATLTQNLR